MLQLVYGDHSRIRENCSRGWRDVTFGFPGKATQCV